MRSPFGSCMPSTQLYAMHKGAFYYKRLFSVYMSDLMLAVPCTVITSTVRTRWTMTGTFGVHAKKRYMHRLNYM